MSTTFAAVLVAVSATALLAAALSVGQPRDDLPARRVEGEMKAEVEPRVGMPLANLCVTGGGFCAILPMPAREPCSCFHPLRGRTLGHAYSGAELEARPGVIPATEADRDELGLDGER